MKLAEENFDNEYETPVLAYNKELDSLVLISCITRSPKEEESSPPQTEIVMTNSKMRQIILSYHSKDMQRWTQKT
jgi:hypothetical protein